MNNQILLALKILSGSYSAESSVDNDITILRGVDEEMVLSCKAYDKLSKVVSQIGNLSIIPNPDTNDN